TAHLAVVLQLEVDAAAAAAIQVALEIEADVVAVDVGARRRVTANGVDRAAVLVAHRPRDVHIRPVAACIADADLTVHGPESGAVDFALVLVAPLEPAVAETERVGAAGHGQRQREQDECGCLAKMPHDASPDMRAPTGDTGLVAGRFRTAGHLPSWVSASAARR